MMPCSPPIPMSMQCSSVYDVQPGDLVQYNMANPVGIVLTVSRPHGLDSIPWVEILWGDKICTPISMRGFAVVSKVMTHESR